MKFRIETLWAFTTVINEAGDEGIVSYFNRAEHQWMPLVTADIDRVASLMEIAQGIADESGNSIRLSHYSNRQNQDIIEPRSSS